jgi:hypothetical protein
VRSVGCRRLGHLLLLQPCGDRLLSARASARVESDVPRDADQPRPDVGRHVVEPSPSDEERVGNDVVSEIGVAAPDIPSDRLEMSLVEAIEPFLSIPRRFHFVSHDPYLSGNDAEFQEPGPRGYILRLEVHRKIWSALTPS